MVRSGLLALLALLALVAIVGCGPRAGSPPSGSTLTVFAAASLTGVIHEAAAAWQGLNPGSSLTISTDSSTALETQIEQGASADVFLSADTSNPERLVRKGLAAGEAVPFATNALAIIVPADNPAAISSAADLARHGVKIVAAGDGVPISRYAAELVAKLGAQPGYGSEFAAAYAANVVSREDDVKAVVAKILLGEGDAAIVYATDARAATGVATIPVPAAANVRAVDAGVVLMAASDPVAAQRFLAWFAGPAGQAILANFGFLPPP